jgi:hypothetical protein
VYTLVQNVYLFCIYIPVFMYTAVFAKLFYRFLQQKFPTNSGESLLICTNFHLTRVFPRIFTKSLRYLKSKPIKQIFKNLPFPIPSLILGPTAFLILPHNPSGQCFAGQHIAGAVKAVFALLFEVIIFFKFVSFKLFSN